MFKQGFTIQAHFESTDVDPKEFRLHPKFWFEKSQSSLTDKSYSQKLAQTEVEFECGVVLLNLNVNYLLKVFSGEY